MGECIRCIDVFYPLYSPSAASVASGGSGLLSTDTMSNMVRTSLPNIKGGPGHHSRFKGKRGAYPSLPNQPSEALAHFMFELAKQVLSKAGGTSSTSVFNQLPANGQNPRGPHRALHMCAFQVK